MNFTDQWAAEQTIEQARGQDDLSRRPLWDRVQVRAARLACRSQATADRAARDLQEYICRETTKALLVAAALGGAFGSLIKRRTKAR